MGVNYNRNTSFALDTDLALLIVDASISVRTWVRPAFDVRCRIS